MNGSATGTSTLCRRCGQAGPGVSGGCPYCGSPLAAVAARPRPTPVFVPVAPGPPHRFEPARIASGPSLSPRARLAIGVSTAVVVLAAAAFLVLRPAPPSPAGAVRDYFAHLGTGDTAAALALVDSEGLSPDSAPLLVPAALADAASRPSGTTVKTAKAAGDGLQYTTVTATYKIGGQSVTQAFAVAKTGDDRTPYRLEQPFMYLSVQAPGGMAVTVNGIAVDAAALARGTPAFPGAYQATTAGNALLAGATKAATYQSGGRGITASISFGQPAIAPGAPPAVQAGVQQYLDTNCVNQAAGYQCPLRAPYRSYGQTTSWRITAYPQIQLSPPDQWRTQVSFTTRSAGSATYTITYADYSGIQQTVTGAVSIDVRGSAVVGQDGAIQIALGY